MRSRRQHWRSAEGGRDTHEGHVEVDRQVDTADLGGTGDHEVLEGDKVSLVEGGQVRGLARRGLDLRSAVVAEDGRVDAAVVRNGTGIGERADPVVVNVLVGGEL